MPGTAPVDRVRKACPLPLPWRGSALSSCISRISEILNNPRANGPARKAGLSSGSLSATQPAEGLTWFRPCDGAQIRDRFGIVPFGGTNGFRLLHSISVREHAERQTECAEGGEKRVIGIEVHAQRAGTV